MPQQTLSLSYNRRDAAIVAWLLGEGLRLVAGLRMKGEVTGDTELVAVGSYHESRRVAALLLQDVPELLAEEDEVNAIQLLVQDYNRIIEPFNAWLDTQPEASGTSTTPKE